FLFASGWLFGITVLIVIVVSYLTAPPDPARIAGLTYASMSDEERRERRASWNWWDVTASCIVLGLVLALYTYFSFWL
ncbi:MAG: Na+/glucose cotransporter, partial [bacterium]|nr:Na+/glucose cotransporter [bacterium]